nr:hypothetical protein [Tanacetum cinerariifolium]
TSGSQNSPHHRFKIVPTDSLRSLYRIFPQSSTPPKQSGSSTAHPVPPPHHSRTPCSSIDPRKRTTNSHIVPRSHDRSTTVPRSVPPPSTTTRDRFTSGSQNSPHHRFKIVPTDSLRSLYRIFPQSSTPPKQSGSSTAHPVPPPHHSRTPCSSIDPRKRTTNSHIVPRSHDRSTTVPRSVPPPSTTTRDRSN